MNVDLSKMCRTCLATDGVIFPIHDRKTHHGNGTEATLAMRLSQISSLMITSHDGLPEKVCLNCVNEINRSYLFRMKCMNSDSALKELLNQLHNETLQEGRHNVMDKSIHIISDIVLMKDEDDDDDVVLIEDDEVGEEEPEELPGEDHNDENMNQDMSLLEPIVSVVEEGPPKKQRRISKDTDDRQRIDHELGDGDGGPTLVEASNEDHYSRTEAFRKTGEEPSHPFPCTLCERTYSYKHSLVRHLKASHADSTYRCTVCSRTMYLREDFDEHMLTHTGERPYACHLCNRSFGQKQSFSNHLTVVHKTRFSWSEHVGPMQEKEI